MMEENSFKFACPHCGQHIKADVNMVGMDADCPACGQPFKVPGNGDVSKDPGVSGECCETNHSVAPPREEAEVAPPIPPAIKVIKKRERFIDRCKKHVKAVGIGVVVLLLFVGVAVIKESLDEAGLRTAEKGEAISKAGAKAKAVGASIDCLLNFIRRPNDRRSQALFKSIESCPKDFQDAVKKYLDSIRKTINDFMSEAKEDLAEEIERELYGNHIRRGSPVDLDPQLASLKNMAVMEAANIVKRRRDARIESAKLRLKAEIENAAKHLIDVAEKYGIDPIKLEDSLLD